MSSKTQVQDTHFKKKKNEVKSDLLSEIVEKEM